METLHTKIYKYKVYNDNKTIANIVNFNNSTKNSK